MRGRFFTMGVDVGSSHVKAALMEHEVGASRKETHSTLIDKGAEKIRKRSSAQVADEVVAYLLDRNGLQYESLAYLASTGEGEMVTRKRGHFYSMTTHARGASYLFPDAATVVDMGALYTRAIKIDANARVLDYRMTGQCASGSGQFIENIARYLGFALEEMGELSLQADKPEMPSGICAVLAETDVINMISRGISAPNIIKGIHLSIAGRIVKLLSSLKAESPIILTGGLALNKGMVQAIEEQLRETGKAFIIKTHPDAIYAGAIGAALWGCFRSLKLNEKQAAAV